MRENSVSHVRDPRHTIRKRKILIREKNLPKASLSTEPALLERYTSDYIQVLVGYYTIYIFMQNFMIPRTIFAPICWNTIWTLPWHCSGNLCCNGWCILVLFPIKIDRKTFGLFIVARQVELFPGTAKRRERLLNYMLFLRVTSTLPNTFINVASPIVDVPYYIFFLATFIELMPATYLIVQAAIALRELRLLGDLYDFQAIPTLFLIGIISVAPTSFNKT